MLPKKLKPLAHLPNKDGFEFVGVKRDGTEISCVVKFSAEVQYIVI